MKQNLKAIEQNLIKDLKKKVKKDSEIIVVIHKVSKSGMQRKMTAFVIYKKQLVNSGSRYSTANKTWDMFFLNTCYARLQQIQTPEKQNTHQYSHYI